MRIAINTLSVVPDRTGGGETYLTNLVHSLARIDRENEYLLLVSPLNRAIFDVRRDNFTQTPCAISSNPGLRLLWEQLFLPVFLHRQRVDILHSPANIAPLAVHERSVLTIQAVLSAEVLRELPRSKTLLLDRLVASSARRAARIAAVSHYTQEQVAKYPGVDPSKLCVVYEGVASQGQIPDAAVEEVRGRYPVPQDFILGVSALVPHKNLDKLIEAFGILKKKGFLAGHKLVLLGGETGRKGYLRLLEQLVERLGLQGEVLFMGMVPHRHVLAFYKLARVFAHPSSVEAFALPTLEAMTQGCPVVASNLTSIPEVVGDAGVLVHPNDVDSLARAIVDVATNVTLRSDLIARGFQRVKEFTWERAALGTLDVYREAVSRS